MKTNIYVNCIKMVLLFMGVFILWKPLQVQAAEAIVRFGSEAYQYEYGEDFPVGIYLESEETIGAYEIHVNYDANVLEYVSGATVVQDGVVVILGDLQGNAMKSMLYFKPLAAGDTTVAITGVSVKNIDSTEDMSIETLPLAPISIRMKEVAYPEGLYYNDVPIDGFEPEKLSYELFLTYGEEVKITDENNETLPLEIAKVEKGVQTIHAIYHKGMEPVVYVFRVHWKEIDVVEEVQATIENSNIEAPQITEAESEVTTMEIMELPQIVEKSPQEIEQSIQESRQKDMIKAGIILALLAVAMIAFCAINGWRTSSIKKRMSPEDDLEKTEVEYDSIKAVTKH